MKYSTTDFLKAATSTAEHFGFRIAENIGRNPVCLRCETPLNYTPENYPNNTNPVCSSVDSSLQSFCQNNLQALEAPVLIYSIEPPTASGEISVSFNIYNVPKSIAEAILIQVGRSLLQDLGYNEPTVRINSLGDAESMQRYSRELANFLRRRIDLMPAATRELMKTGPLPTLLDLVRHDHDLAYKAPNPLEYLSDKSRKHFREIIEYLDMTDTLYEINPKMLENHHYFSDTLFSITSQPIDDEPFDLEISGGRFDDFVFRKTDQIIPAAGTVITLRNSPKIPSRFPRLKKLRPDIYVIQLGFGPKIRSLMLIDELKQAKVPVYHNLSCDSLSEQLREAEEMGVHYTVIVGQKEFIEETVILRDMKNRNQENISTSQAVKKLKKQLIVA